LTGWPGDHPDNARTPALDHDAFVVVAAHVGIFTGSDLNCPPAVITPVADSLSSPRNSMRMARATEHRRTAAAHPLRAVSRTLSCERCLSIATWAECTPLPCAPAYWLPIVKTLL
jgi:hypothetical protein